MVYLRFFQLAMLVFVILPLFAIRIQSHIDESARRKAISTCRDLHNSEEARLGLDLSIAPATAYNTQISIFHRKAEIAEERMNCLASIRQPQRWYTLILNRL